MYSKWNLGTVALAVALGMPACANSAGDEAAGQAAGDGDGDGDGDDEGGQGAGPAVGQGGAQDFGQFRAILEAGEIPGPSTIDDVGFFAEHRIELGSADCGEQVCLQGELGVMGNMLNGANCTMVMMGMTTPINPAELERPPLNLVLAIDTSGSMRGLAIDYVRDGLHALGESLRPEDSVTLVGFSDRATVLAEDVAGSNELFGGAVDMLEADGQTNLYAGLRTAFEVAQRNAAPERQNRVILLSDGQATTGLVDDPRLLTLTKAYSAQGIGLSTIGVGRDFSPDLMRGLSELGGGAFYFLEDPAAVQEVFVEEASALLLPIALNVTITADVSPGYTLRGMYGTKLFELSAQRASIEIPSLQIAHRTSASDNAGGRRGGGGVMIAELIPEPGVQADPGAVGMLNFRYQLPQTETIVEQQVEVLSPLSPGETPDAGFFSGQGVEKSFVALNIYMAFKMAATRAEAGDRGGAHSLLVAVGDAADGWLTTNNDPDIEDDLRYVNMFVQNLEQRGALNQPAAPAPDPWPVD